MKFLAIFLMLVEFVYSFADNDEDDDVCGQFYWAGEQSEHDLFVFKCVLPRVQDLNYAQLPGNITAGLVVNCTFTLTTLSRDIFWPSVVSTFANASLSHLSALKVFQINQCFFKKLEANSFRELGALETILINSRFENTPGMVLSPGLFDFNPLLQHVSISSADIVDVPKELFCKLKSLTYVNWNENRLEAIDSIGCNVNNSCCPHLQNLYLESNQVTRVKSKDLQLQNLIALHLSRNKIEFVEKGALDELPNLVILELAENKLAEIDENLFKKNQNLEYIDLSGNRLKTIAQNIFRGLTSLTHLLLSRNRIELNGTNPSIFRDLRSLLHLDLSGNLIYKLSSEMLENTLLQILLVSHNQLTVLEDDDLKGLAELEVLNVSNNVLINVSMGALKHLVKIKSIDFGRNKLVAIPNFHRNRELEYIDLMGNEIDFIGDNSFDGLINLIGLRMSANKIKSVPEMAFRDTKNLFIINLGNNSIENIEPRSFLQSNQLHYLLLDGNKIQWMNDLFKNVTTFLNLSGNSISKFDFQTISNQLVELDLSHNQIHVIFDPRQDQYNYNLKRFYASDNKLRIFNAFYFPPTIEVIELARNKIAKTTALSRAHLPQLFIVDLQYNEIREMTLDKFYPPISTRQIMPELIVYGNTLICSCTNVWIKDARQTPKERTYPRISGAEECLPVYRRTPFPHRLVAFNLVPKNQFLCEYDEFTVLGPTQFCPAECVCYRDGPITENIVDCQGVNWDNATQLQNSLPSSATDIYLDENKNLLSVTAKLRSNFTRLKALYLNSSELTSIDPALLSSCPTLKELYLHRNKLTGIRGTEFNLVPELVKLHLHENEISSIAEGAFAALKKLNELTLSKNLLHQPQLWDMGNALRLIYLRGNPIHCDCNYTLTFQKWISANQLVQLIDIDQVICYELQVPIMEFNDSSCFPVTLNSTGTTLAISISVSIFTILLILIVLIYLYRLEMQVWLYSRYGVRIFRQNMAADDDKRYDAFVAYSNTDDEWVANELVPNLNDYKLCLHQRDFPIGAYISDSIVDAVENSRRTILILTPSFVESDWCIFEFKSAHLQCLKDRCNRLLIVVLEKVKLDELDKELRAYLSTNTYLDLQDKRFWQKLKFALPDLKPKIEATAEA